MKDETLPEPCSWLVHGGKTFVDRGFMNLAAAEESVAKRKDGATISPLYTASTLREAVKGRDETIRALEGERDALRAELDALKPKERIDWDALKCGTACPKCGTGVLSMDSNGYHTFNRCMSCAYVPMWDQEGNAWGLIVIDAARSKGSIDPEGL